MIVSFVDKAIIAVLAALVITIAQSQYEEHKAMNKMLFEVTNWQSTLIIKNMTKLSEAVDVFINIIYHTDEPLAEIKIFNFLPLYIDKNSLVGTIYSVRDYKKFFSASPSDVLDSGKIKLSWLSWIYLLKI